MSEQQKQIENPPAFPTEVQLSEPGDLERGHHQHSEYTAKFHGMTLRDYFAAKAMPEITSLYIRMNGQFKIDFETRSGDADVIAEYSYILADAMLKARQS